MSYGVWIDLDGPSGASGSPLLDDERLWTAGLDAPLSPLHLATSDGGRQCLLMAWPQRSSASAWQACGRAARLTRRAALHGSRVVASHGTADRRSAPRPDDGEVRVVERFSWARPMAASELPWPVALEVLFISDAQTEWRLCTAWSSMAAATAYLGGAARARALAPAVHVLLGSDVQTMRVHSPPRPPDSRGLAGPIDLLDEQPERCTAALQRQLARTLPVLGLRAAPPAVYFVSRAADVARLRRLDGSPAWRSAPGAGGLARSTTQRLMRPATAGERRAIGDTVRSRVAALDAYDVWDVWEQLLQPLVEASIEQLADRLPLAGGDEAEAHAWATVREFAARTLSAALAQRLTGTSADAIAPMRWTTRTLPAAVEVAGVRMPAGTQLLLNLLDPPGSRRGLRWWLDELPPALRVFAPMADALDEVLHRAGRRIEPDSRALQIRDHQFDAPAVLIARRTPVPSISTGEAHA